MSMNTWLGYIVGVNENACNIGISEIDKEWFEKLTIVETGKEINVKLDSGAGANVMGMHDFAKVGPMVQFETTIINLITYTCCKIPILGKVSLRCKVKNNIADVEFYIADNKKTVPVFGREILKRLN